MLKSGMRGKIVNLPEVILPIPFLGRQVAAIAPLMRSGSRQTSGGSSELWRVPLPFKGRGTLLL